MAQLIRFVPLGSIPEAVYLHSAQRGNSIITAAPCPAREPFRSTPSACLDCAHNAGLAVVTFSVPYVWTTLQRAEGVWCNFPKPGTAAGEFPPGFEPQGPRGVDIAGR